jgi:hypothetical protein
VEDREEAKSNEDVDVGVQPAMSWIDYCAVIWGNLSPKIAIVML